MQMIGVCTALPDSRWPSGLEQKTSLIAAAVAAFMKAGVTSSVHSGKFSRGRPDLPFSMACTLIYRSSLLQACKRMQRAVITGKCIPKMSGVKERFPTAFLCFYHNRLFLKVAWTIGTASAFAEKRFSGYSDTQNKSLRRNSAPECCVKGRTVKIQLKFCKQL